MKRLAPIFWGFALLTSSVQAAIVYPHIDYQPPTYDVGHPELITESNVLLSPQELKKRSARKRKLATLSISQEAVQAVLEQAESLLPENYIYLSGDGQPTAIPEKEKSLLWWESYFRDEKPVLNLQVSIPRLDLRFDDLKISIIYKKSYRFEKNKEPIYQLYFNDPYIRGEITIIGNSLYKLDIRQSENAWRISNESEPVSNTFNLYHYKYKLGGNDTLTPDPKGIRTTP